MCRATHSNTRACGICVKLKNLLKVHYKKSHPNYTVCITINENAHRHLHKHGNLISQKRRSRPAAVNVIKHETGQTFDNKEGKESLPVSFQVGVVAATSEQATSEQDETLYVVINHAPVADENAQLTSVEAGDIENYVCICGEQFNTAEQLKSHEEIHTKPQDTKTCTYGCQYCDERFQRAADLRAHMPQHGIYVCACDATFYSEQDLIAHEETMHEQPTPKIVKVKRSLRIKRKRRTRKRQKLYEINDLSELDELNNISEEIDDEIDDDIENVPKIEEIENYSQYDEINNESEVEVYSEPRVRRVAKPPIRRQTCTVCDRTFRKKATLRQHKTTHGIYDCLPPCNQSFSSKQDFDEHTATQECSARDKWHRPHTCVVCDKRFKSLSHLREHKRIHGIHDCVLSCGMSFGSREELAVHKASEACVAAAADPNMDYESLSCAVCLKTFSTRQVLKRHMSTHESTPRFLCSECPKSFKRQAEFRQHCMVHAGKGFHCMFCDKVFDRKSGLAIHERIHTGEKPYRCEYCGAAFPTLFQLKSHIRIHTGERPYKCDKCDFTTARYSGLAYHKFTHINVKTVLCCICSKLFKTQRVLNEHMKTHYGIKPFPCEVCAKAFKSKSALNAHMSSHSDECRYKCKHCPSAYKRSYHRLKHMRTHHPEYLDESKVLRGRPCKH